MWSKTLPRLKVSNGYTGIKIKGFPKIMMPRHYAQTRTLTTSHTMRPVHIFTFWLASCTEGLISFFVWYYILHTLPPHTENLLNCQWNFPVTFNLHPVTIFYNHSNTKFTCSLHLLNFPAASQDTKRKELSGRRKLTDSIPFCLNTIW